MKAVYKPYLTKTHNKENNNMRLLTFIAFAFVGFVLPLQAEIFTLNYSNTNKWLASTQNAPLFKLRGTLVKNKQSDIQVMLSPEKRELNIERLAIIAEILGRKISALTITEIENTGDALPANRLLIKLPE